MIETQWLLRDCTREIKIQLEVVDAFQMISETIPSFQYENKFTESNLATTAGMNHKKVHTHDNKVYLVQQTQNTCMDGDLYFLVICKTPYHWTPRV